MKNYITETLKEESFKDAFVEVFNGLIKRRDEIEENYKLCLDALTNTSEYERQLEDLNNGCAEVQQLIHSLLITNGKQSDLYLRFEKYEPPSSPPQISISIIQTSVLNVNRSFGIFEKRRKNTV